MITGSAGTDTNWKPMKVPLVELDAIAFDNAVATDRAVSKASRRMLEVTVTVPDVRNADRVGH